MADLVLDTDAASQVFRGREPSWVSGRVEGHRTWLTFIGVGELAKWTEVRSWGTRRRDRVDAWVSARPVIPFDREIARIWGRLAAAGQMRGRTRPQNDTWVAACCIRYGVPLLTFNQKDFADFAQDGLDLITE